MANLERHGRSRHQLASALPSMSDQRISVEVVGVLGERTRSSIELPQPGVGVNSQGQHARARACQCIEQAKHRVMSADTTTRLDGRPAFRD